MSAITVKASEARGEEARSYETTYDFGDNLGEAISLFGEDVVFKCYLNAAKISAQGIMRRMIKAGHSDEEITRMMSEWKVGVPMTVENEAATVESLAKKAANMDVESLQELLAKMERELEAKLK